MSPWRSRWTHDGVADLEREIIAKGFLRTQEAAVHLSKIVKFHTGSYALIADQIVRGIAAGKIIAEVITELEPELRGIAKIAINEYRMQSTDFEELDLLVRIHAPLAELLRKEISHV